MTHQVIVRQLAEPVTVEDGDTILLAAQFSGFDYPASCASGNCGACKSLLVRGEVEMLPYSEFALTDEERAAGLILACRAQPLGDCEVAWLEEGEIAAHPQRKLLCSVVSSDAMTHDIRRLRLQIDSGGPFDFSAGQYAAVTFPASRRATIRWPASPVPASSNSISASCPAAGSALTCWTA